MKKFIAGFIAASLSAGVMAAGDAAACGAQRSRPARRHARRPPGCCTCFGDGFGQIVASDHCNVQDGHGGPS